MTGMTVPMAPQALVVSLVVPLEATLRLVVMVPQVALLVLVCSSSRIVGT